MPTAGDSPRAEGEHAGDDSQAVEPVHDPAWPEFDSDSGGDSTARSTGAELAAEPAEGVAETGATHETAAADDEEPGDPDASDETGQEAVEPVEGEQAEGEPPAPPVPDGEPADDEPADDEPADDEPADDEPADDEPDDELLDDEVPVELPDDESAGDEPADEAPVGNDPAVAVRADENPADVAPGAAGGPDTEDEPAAEYESALEPEDVPGSVVEDVGDAAAAVDGVDDDGADGVDATAGVDGVDDSDERDVGAEVTESGGTSRAGLDSEGGDDQHAAAEAEKAGAAPASQDLPGEQEMGTEAGIDGGDEVGAADSGESEPENPESEEAEPTEATAPGTADGTEVPGGAEESDTADETDQLSPVTEPATGGTESPAEQEPAEQEPEPAGVEPPTAELVWPPAVPEWPQEDTDPFVGSALEPDDAAEPEAVEPDDAAEPEAVEPDDAAEPEAVEPDDAAEPESADERPAASGESDEEPAWPEAEPEAEPEPAAEEPDAETPPATETPPDAETPTTGTPTTETPGEEALTEEPPVGEGPAAEAPVDDTPLDDTPVDDTTEELETDAAAEPAAEPDGPVERTQLLPAVRPVEERQRAEGTQFLPGVRPEDESISPPSSGTSPAPSRPAPPWEPRSEQGRAESPSRAESTEIIDLTAMGASDAASDTEPLVRPAESGTGRPAAGPETHGDAREDGVGEDESGQAEPPNGPVDGDGDSAGGDSAGGGRSRRKRRARGVLLVAAVVVLVVAVAAGVVRWVPGVAGKLGLGGAAAVESPPEPGDAGFTVRPVATDAPAPTASGVAARLDEPSSDPALAKLTGVVLDPASGNTLWQRGPNEPLAPGSANKLLTGAAALLALDHEERLTTKVVAGSEPGTAVLVGGGDPTLSSLPDGERSVYWNAAHLSDLVAQVKRNSNGTIHTVYIDQSRYTGPSHAQGWSQADIEAGNWAPIVPAMLDGGRQDPKKPEGSPRSHNPSGDLLQRFAQQLGAGAAGNRKAPGGTKVLGAVHSAPLGELVANTLTISDNVLAEALGREVARSQGLPESFAGAHQAVLKVLSGNGFDVSGTTLADSSGLSTKDKIPARLLGSVVGAASAPAGTKPRTAKLRPLLDGLPVAAGSGSLSERFEEQPSSAGKGWVRAKTGTLSAVSTLTGIVTDSDGRLLVFAFMSNGSTPTDARPALDTMAAALRGCGCRG